MKYYTDTIPLSLAEKLKEKGMPDIEIEWNPIRGKHYCFKTYAEVFDWLLDEKIYVRIIPFGASRIGEETWDWTYYIDELGEPCTETEYFWHTWHEAANDAIEKALELIEEDRI